MSELVYLTSRLNSQGLMSDKGNETKDERTSDMNTTGLEPGAQLLKSNVLPFGQAQWLEPNLLKTYIDFALERCSEGKVIFFYNFHDVLNLKCTFAV